MIFFSGWIIIIFTNHNSIPWNNLKQPSNEVVPTSQQDSKDAEDRVEEKGAESNRPVVHGPSVWVGGLGHHRQNVGHSWHSVCGVQTAPASVQHGPRAHRVPPDGGLGAITLHVHPNLTHFRHAACLGVAIVVGGVPWMGCLWGCHGFLLGWTASWTNRNCDKWLKWDS